MMTTHFSALLDTVTRNHRENIICKLVKGLNSCLTILPNTNRVIPRDTYNVHPLPHIELTYPGACG